MGRSSFRVCRCSACIAYMYAVYVFMLRIGQYWAAHWYYICTLCTLLNLSLWKVFRGTICICATICISGSSFSSLTRFTTPSVYLLTTITPSQFYLLLLLKRWGSPKTFHKVADALSLVKTFSTFSTCFNPLHLIWTFCIWMCPLHWAFVLIFTSFLSSSQLRWMKFCFLTGCKFYLLLIFSIIPNTFPSVDT